MTFQIKYHYVFRDAIQSLFGTNPSAAEMLETAKHTGQYGMDRVQTGGGTFFDIFARKGRDEWQEVEAIIDHFKEQSVRQTALIRGDFLFGYEPQPYDVIRATVFEYAKMGMNVLQNFHGMNDHRALVGVAQAVQEAKAEGYDISAQGVICIEDNPNITLESCLAHAEKLIEMGHEGFYLKSASGVVDLDFVYELTKALYAKFPDQDVNIHVHATYNLAEPAYLAAAKAAKEANKTIIMDVQTPAFHGPTSHPDVIKMNDLFLADPDFANYAPAINEKAIQADAQESAKLRFAYRHTETSINPELLTIMQKARVPGGASTTLRSIQGLEDNLSILLGTKDWDAIQRAIYEQQAKILPAIGNPTQVTPYANNTTIFAAVSLMSELQAKKTASMQKPNLSEKELEKIGLAARYKTLPPGILNYLSGKHGTVGTNADRLLRKKVLQINWAKTETPFIQSIDLPDGLSAATQKLTGAGIENPTIRQQIAAATHGDIKHIVAVHEERNAPQQPPAQPFYAQDPASHYRNPNAKDIRDAMQAIGGVVALQQLAEHVACLKALEQAHATLPKEVIKQWQGKHMLAITSFMHSIEKRLQENGFNKSQAEIQTGKLRLGFNGSINSLEAAIQDVLQAKGPGLFEFLQESLIQAAETAPDRAPVAAAE